MGLSRRRFTKEFKLGGVRRLEAGVSLAEVARGLEVNPKAHGIEISMSRKANPWDNAVCESSGKR